MSVSFLLVRAGVVASGIVLIGKEASQVGECAEESCSPRCGTRDASLPRCKALVQLDEGIGTTPSRVLLAHSLHHNMQGHGSVVTTNKAMPGYAKRNRLFEVAPEIRGRHAPPDTKVQFRQCGQFASVGRLDEG